MPQHHPHAMPKVEDPQAPPISEPTSASSSLPTAPMSPEEERKAREERQKKFVEALLELGRNWAVAVAVAAFGAGSFHAEAVTGLWQNKNWVLGITFSFALLWVGLAIARFLTIVQPSTRGVIPTLKGLLATLILVGFGLAIVSQAGSHADNAMLVRLCSDYRDRPASAMHQHPPCQSLYLQRAERERRYMGAPAPASAQ